jgi:hypothetical protein
VSASITVSAGSSVVKRVVVEDLWSFDETELLQLKSQAEDLARVLRDTQYDTQAILLRGDIISTVDIMLQKQIESYETPQLHIVTHRENKVRFTKVTADIEKLKDLALEADASRGFLGKIGGMQTVATWGTILVLLFGFGALAYIMMKTSRRQNEMTARIFGSRYPALPHRRPNVIKIKPRSIRSLHYDDEVPKKPSE